MAQCIKLPPVRRSSHEYQFKSQTFHCWFSSLLVWTPSTHARDPDELPGSWFQPGILDHGGHLKRESTGRKSISQQLPFSLQLFLTNKTNLRKGREWLSAKEQVSDTAVNLLLGSLNPGSTPDSSFLANVQPKQQQ